jgi:hypothetical protein
MYRKKVSSAYSCVETELTAGRFNTPPNKSRGL